MDRLAAVSLRILGPRAVLLGTGDGSSLENVYTENLPDGSICWVSDQSSYYVLHKDSAVIPVPPIVIAASGPGRWFQLSTGGGGGIPMPDGTVNLPEGANFINELTLGIYRPAAGLIGVASGNFKSAEFGNGTITNVDPNSPSVVRYSMRGFNRPLTGGENETTAFYARVDPSIGDPQQAAFYVDITSAQLDTFGPAIKVVHAGHGDGIYVAQFANGSAYEAASFADGSRGYISTIQLAGQPNSTLFNALWDQADVPNFGMYYADLSTANALTIRKRAATAVDGLTQIRIIDEAGPQRFAVYNDGSQAMNSVDAAGGTPNVASPELRISGSVWDGAAAHASGWLTKVITSGAPATNAQSILAFYQVTPAGTVLPFQIANDATVADGIIMVLGLNGAGSIHAKNYQSSIALDLIINAGNLAVELGTPPAANDTTLTNLLLKDHAGSTTAKNVSQGAPDSAGVGFRSLVVPNDAADDTAVDADDFAVANFGGSPGISVAAGSTCRRGRVTITADAGGGGPAPGWTITLTYPTAFAATPFAIAQRNDANNPPTVTAMQVSATTTTTQLVMSEVGTSAPTGGTAYTFTWMVME